MHCLSRQTSGLTHRDTVVTVPAATATYGFVMTTWEKIDADFNSIAGFRSAGAIGGIKDSGKPDVALIVADEAVVSAATFTRNQAAAASVAYCRAVLEQPLQRAIVVNSGNANCCTGAYGMQDTKRMAELTAEHISCSPEEVYVSSTGVVGVPLPMEAVETGINQAAAQLDKPEHTAATAILTTDLVEKTCTYQHKSGYSVAGICKGSGMIHPNMATMLAYVITDVAIDKEHLQYITSRAVKRSFNSISVDNDESTNDTCVVMASGKSGCALNTNEELGDFESMLTAVMQDLAQQIVRDGEGATNFIEVTVKGCAHEEDADKIAMSICDSMLVKTAIAGKDPNWGRIVVAAGYSGVQFRLEDLRVYLNDVLLFSEGAGHDDDQRPFVLEGAQVTREQLSQTMVHGEQQIVLDFGHEGKEATRWTSDLTHGYITINADYTT